MRLVRVRHSSIQDCDHVEIREACLLKQSHFLLEVLLNCVSSCQLKLVCCHNRPDFLMFESGDEAAFDVFVGELTEM